MNTHIKTIFTGLRITTLLALSLAALVAPPMARAAALSDYLENKLVDHVFRGTAYTAPANTYVALFTSACSDSAAGTEVATGSYLRVAISSAGASWTNTQSSGTGVSSGTGGTISNAAAVNFPTPSAGWGTVTYWGLFDASTSGNLLICAALTASKTINSGDTVSFAIGALTVQIDN